VPSRNTVGFGRRIHTVEAAVRKRRIGQGRGIIRELNAFESFG
jgi:hypothetical protein